MIKHLQFQGRIKYLALYDLKGLLKKQETESVPSVSRSSASEFPTSTVVLWMEEVLNGGKEESSSEKNQTITVRTYLISKEAYSRNAGNKNNLTNKSYQLVLAWQLSVEV